MKRIISLIMLASIMLSLSSCGRYVSSYSAVGLVRNQTSHSCEASFLSLDGILVYKLKRTAAGEGDINYSVQVDEGELRLYYDIYGTKEELAQVKSGESIEGSGGYVECDKAVYIIVEATEKSRGKFVIELN